MTSKTHQEAQARLQAALERVEQAAQGQSVRLERDLLEAKAENVTLKKELEELRQKLAADRAKVEQAETGIRQVHARLDEMALEIVDLLKQAGAR